MSGIVYKLYADEVNFYVGSTTRTLGRRLSAHKQKAKAGSTARLHETMREIGLENWQIEALEQAAEEDLTALEQRYIEELDPPLNSKRANGRDVERKKEKEKIQIRRWVASNPFRYRCSCGYHTGAPSHFKRHVAAGLRRGEEHEHVEEQEEQEE